MSVQHTPGPWKHRPVYKGHEMARDEIVAADGSIVVNDVIEAVDAPLIAAAPALLKALVEMMPTNLGALPDTMPDSATLPLDVTFGELRRARAAIAKAEGR